MQPVPAVKTSSSQFNEVEKVLQVFGSNMSKDNVVTATSDNRRSHPNYRKGK